MVLLLSSTAAIAAPLCAVGSHYPPFRIVDHGHEQDMQGIHAELLHEMARCLDTPSQYRALPYVRAMGQLDTGEADVYIGLMKTPERQKILHYVEPPYRTDSHKVFYLRKGEGERVQGFDDLKKLERGVGISRGSRYFQAFDESVDIRKDPAINTLLSLRMLLAGRVDAVIATDGVGDYIARQNHMHERIERASYGYYGALPAYMTVSRASPWAERLDEMNACMAQMVQSGRVDEMVERQLHDIRLPEWSPQGDD